MNHRQAEPGALPNSLSTEKGFNGRGERLLIHPDTSIADPKTNIFARRQLRLMAGADICFSDRDRKPATLWHGVAGVYRQIQDGHLKLVDVGECSGRLSYDFHFDLDVGSGRTGNQLRDSADEL